MTDNPNLQGMTVFAMRAIWEQCPLIETAKRHGATVVAVDEEEDAEGFEIADHAEVVPSLRDLDACLDIAEEYDIDAVVSDECDYSLFTTAYLGDRLGLPSVGVTTAQLTTNKKRMRQAVDAARDPGEHTVSQPAYRVCSTLAEVERAADEAGYPCVVKPTDNRGGFGVNRVDSPDEVPIAFYEGLENSHAREVLVESFVEGTPLSVDGYCLAGEHRSLAVGSKNTSMGSLYPKLEITYPATISEGELETVRRANEEVAEMLGVSLGATHAEYILTDDGDVSLLEFQNRGGGVYTSAKIVPAITGFDVSRQLLADAVGQSSGQEEESYTMNRAAFMRFLDFKSGYVASIEGLDAVRSRDDILALRLYLEAGEEIEDFSAFTDSHGVIVTAGDTPNDAISAAEKALSKLVLTYA